MTTSGPIVHVVGARPNFIKAAPVIVALGNLGLDQRLIHTGQHYDTNLSGVFFSELDLPTPNVNLGVGPGTHAAQTAAIMQAIERPLIELAPSWLVVYGDVNSTIAASLVAAKLRIPTAHVEAGLRSFDDRMPEEINRRVTDHVCGLLFVTAPEGIENLRAEGIPTSRVEFVGNPMIDTLLANLDKFDVAAARKTFGLTSPYVVATVHRPSNVDEPGSARRIVEMLNDISSQATTVVPLHPRGRDALEAAGLQRSQRMLITEPLSYVAFMSLVRGATAVVTDSGGVQEESTMLDVPCLTIRENTERPVTITHGTNRLMPPQGVGLEIERLLRDGFRSPGPKPPLWDGRAGTRIAKALIERIGEKQP